MALDVVCTKLLEVIKKKGIFSEYLPKSFGLDTSFNIWGAGASSDDKIEPCSYFMSRFGKTGDRRLISIPEISGFVSTINYLRDEPKILSCIVSRSKGDTNSFSRIINESDEVVESDSRYGGVNNLKVSINEAAEAQEEERVRSVFVENMLSKIRTMRGARGILHVDISEFYRSIYTHLISAIGVGVDKAQKYFVQDSQENDYRVFVTLDQRIRRMNASRTSGILVGPFLSRVLSESLLAMVDEELRNQKLTFVRYADDYEIAIYEEDDIEDVKSRIVTVLERYSFRLNNEKTFFEEYPFYLFSNYEKVIRRLVGEGGIAGSADIIELFNKFLELEKKGEKGAVRYLLQTYTNEYQVADQQLYASYLLNTLCNDEKALGLSCEIIIKEYKTKRVTLDKEFYEKIVHKLQHELNRGHDLEVVWLTYLLKYTDYSISKELINQVLASRNDLAIIIITEEWPEMIETGDIESCWNNAGSWLLLYQIALRHPEKRTDFYSKLLISKNEVFYNKLFKNGVSFYNKTGNKPSEQQSDEIEAKSSNGITETEKEV